MKRDFSLKNKLRALFGDKCLCNAVEINGAICSNKNKTKGLCGKHYQRWLKHGDYNIILKKHLSKEQQS